MQKTVFPALLLSVALHGAQEVGDDADIEKLVEMVLLEQSALFSRCAPMSLVVVVTDEAEKTFKLSSKSVEDAAESRLRSARLYGRGTGQVLHVLVDSFGVASVAELSLLRVIDDAGYGVGA